MSCQRHCHGSHLPVAVGIALFCISSVVTAQELPPAPDFDLAAASSRQAEQRLLASLQKKINVDWRDVSLEEALDKIRREIDGNLIIDRQALSNEGMSLDKEEKVSLQLGEATLWQTLYFLLKDSKLAWIATDGILEITTKENASEASVTRVYDVSRLVKALEPGVRQINLAKRAKHSTEAQGGPGGGGSGVGASFFSVPVVDWTAALFGQFGGNASAIPTTGPLRPDAETFVVERRLKGLLTTVIDSKWEDVDAEGGIIGVGHGHLIVRQTYQDHFLIQGMLRALESLMAADGQRTAFAIRRPGYPFPEEARIAEALVKVRSIDVNKRPVNEVLQQLAREAGIRLLIDERALAEEAIACDRPVELKLADVSLAVILRKLLAPNDLDWCVEEGTLVVTTRYQEAKARSISLHNTGRILETSQPDEFVALLQLPEHDSWDAAHGGGGALFLLTPESLVVRQSRRIHAEVNSVLSNLRETAAPSDAPRDARHDAKAKLVTKMYATSGDLMASIQLFQNLPAMVDGDWSRGTIWFAGRTLVISQTEAVHERLQQFFRDLAEAEQQVPASKSELKNPGVRDR